jgi:glycosyltransferase involved in cell wall biosynthesis
MDKPTVSIIVPIYKVEKELSKCVESILKQTYQEIEVILVDDGSPDRCPQMCDEFAQQDKRIKVIHKCNGGLSDARNAGLDLARGEFISFIDSDDWVAENFIEQLVVNIQDTDSDIAICGYTMVNEAGEAFDYTTGGDDLEVIEHDEAIRELFAQQKFYCMMWMKLYRRELFDDVRFPKGKLYEDIAVSLPLFQKSRRCVLLNEKLYYYLQRDRSIVNSTFHKNKLDMLEYIQEMIAYSHQQGHKYDLEAEAFYLKGIWMLLLQAYKDSESEEARQAIDFLKKELKNHRSYIWKNRYIQKRRQFAMYAILLNFPSQVLTSIWKIRMKLRYE